MISGKDISDVMYSLNGLQHLQKQEMKAVPDNFSLYFYSKQFSEETWSKLQLVQILQSCGTLLQLFSPFPSPSLPPLLSLSFPSSSTALAHILLTVKPVPPLPPKTEQL